MHRIKLETDEDWGERTPLLFPNGVVVAPHRLAAAAGAQLLQTGATAADAAVAAAAVGLAVSPHRVPLSPDLLALVHTLEQDHVALLESRSTAPSYLSPNEEYRILSSALPAGWAALLARYGTRSLDDLLQAAEEYARDGFPASGSLSHAIVSGMDIVGLDSPAMVDRRVSGGVRIRNTRLSEELRAVGRDRSRALNTSHLSLLGADARTLEDIPASISDSSVLCWSRPIPTLVGEYSFVPTLSMSDEARPRAVLDQAAQLGPLDVLRRLISLDWLAPESHEVGGRTGAFGDIGRNSAVCAFDHRGMAVVLVQVPGGAYQGSPVEGQRSDRMQPVSGDETSRQKRAAMTPTGGIVLRANLPELLFCSADGLWTVEIDWTRRVIVASGDPAAEAAAAGY